MEEKFIITEIIQRAHFGEQVGIDKLGDEFAQYVLGEKIYNTYPEAQEAIQKLPPGAYQIQKIFVVK